MIFIKIFNICFIFLINVSTMLPNKLKINKKCRKIRNMINKNVSLKELNQTLNGMVAHLSKGNSYKAIKKLRITVRRYNTENIIRQL